LFSKPPVDFASRDVGVPTDLEAIFPNLPRAQVSFDNQSLFQTDDGVLVAIEVSSDKSSHIFDRPVFHSSWNIQTQTEGDMTSLYSLGEFPSHGIDKDILRDEVRAFFKPAFL
jgi:hypothetical protein